MADIAKKSIAWEKLRPKIENSKKDREATAKEVQDLEERLKVACEQLQKAEN